ncbi:LysR family transcriptional regulator [Cupriavidus necator]|uniref:LysR family transcriptional regulator n=1 Tax=Cupriavidus necator TaxID=106590 RepID=UPI0039C2AACB
MDHSSRREAMMQKLRVRDLHLLIEIARCRSLSAVAEEIGSNQPAVSRWLKDIETTFGTPLFDRDRASGMRPTPVGTLVLVRARTMLADIAALSSEVEAFTLGVGGNIRLGIIPFVSGALVKSVVLELVGPPHQMTVTMAEGSTDGLLIALRQHDLDAVIGRLQAPGASDASDLHAEILLRQKACLVAHQDHALAKQGRCDFADLREQLWVLPPTGSPTRLAINQAFAVARLPTPSASIETSSPRTIYDVVRERTDMLAIVPAEIGHDLERLGGVRSLRFPGEFALPPVALLTLADRQELPYVRTLRHCLRRTISRGLPLG